LFSIKTLGLLYSDFQLFCEKRFVKIEQKITTEIKRRIIIS
jgi:hypothetical protein